MSNHRSKSPQSISQSPSRSLSPSLSPPIQSLSEFRLSGDSERSGASSPPVNGLNGTSAAFLNGKVHEFDDGAGLDPIQRLQRELDRTNEEKEKLAAQYQNLLDKLTAMRTTVGNKLKQDAEELDRREQLVQQLTAQNEDLSSTIDTLKSELIASHQEVERASHERDSLARTRDFQESLVRERELREAQGELERCRIERDEWERTAMQERMAADEAKVAVEALKRDVELEREAREREAGELEFEVEKSNNLQSVLEDFQAAKDHELRQAVKDYESQLNQVTQSLAEFKHRALTAELQLEESHSNTSRTQELEKEVREKNLLIGKLRHEAVIINEHLMEALRRLRRNSSDTNVDRRLVTNVLLQFLSTDRADPKRFEMLSLLSSILSWTEAEREKAGLQRAHGPTVPSTGASSFWGRSSSSVNLAKGGGAELEKTDETESFSRLWVEFLLTEAASGSGEHTPTTATRSNNSLPGSPTFSSVNRPSLSLSPGSAGKTRRLSSFSSSAMASSPNLTLEPPPSRKGKEKEVVLS